MSVAVSLRQTCGAFPSQWEGTTSDGRYVYVRYRHGCLWVGIGDTPDEAVLGGTTVVNEQLSDSYDGVMSSEQLVRVLADLAPDLTVEGWEGT